jgi:type VI secretion system protein VasG
MVIVPYFPVRDEALKKIIRLKLGKIRRRLIDSHRINLTYDDNLLNEIAARCTEVESGARNVDNILSNTMLPDLSRQILGRLADGKQLEQVAVSVKDGALAYDWNSVAN